MGGCSIHLQPELCTSVSPQLAAFASYRLPESSQQPQEVAGVDSTSTLWQKFSVDDPLRIPKNGEHHLLRRLFLSGLGGARLTCFKPCRPLLLGGAMVEMEPGLVHCDEVWRQSWCATEHAKDVPGQLQPLVTLCCCELVGAPDTRMFLHLQGFCDSFVRSCQTDLMSLGDDLERCGPVLIQYGPDCMQNIGSQLGGPACWLADCHIMAATPDLGHPAVDGWAAQGVSTMDLGQMSQNFTMSHAQIHTGPQLNTLCLAGVLHVTPEPLWTRPKTAKFSPIKHAKTAIGQFTTRPSNATVATQPVCSGHRSPVACIMSSDLGRHHAEEDPKGWGSLPEKPDLPPPSEHTSYLTLNTRPSDILLKAVHSWNHLIYKSTMATINQVKC